MVKYQIAVNFFKFIMLEFFYDILQEKCEYAIRSHTTLDIM